MASLHPAALLLDVAEIAAPDSLVAFLRSRIQRQDSVVFERGIEMMIKPRFVARFLAWLGGYFWLPCPVCGEYFAGFEAYCEFPPASVVVQEDGVLYHKCVCSKPKCVAVGIQEHEKIFQQMLGQMRL